MVIDAEALLRVQQASYARAGQALAQSWPRESAMDAEQFQSFLGKQRYCVLATTTPRGRPLARPIAFTVLGAAFWFATVGGPRLRNLELVPWASVVISEGQGDDHRALAVDGSVTIIRDPSEELLSAWESRHGSRAGWASAWFELTPRRLLSYAARTIPTSGG